MSVDTLKQAYPWPPKSVLTAEKNKHGWFSGGTHFAQFCGPDVKVYLELGSWLGMSARWVADRCPNAQVICVDHWEGSAEHHKKIEWREMLPTLYETFLVNMYEYRERLIPLRASTLDGMRTVHAHGVVPDLIYIDACHHEEPVYQDVSLALELFPKAQIIGDDWRFGDVKRGVHRALRERKIEHRLVEADKVWSLLKEPS